MNALTKPEMQEIAERIRGRYRRAIEDIVATGNDLNKVKGSIGYGKFGDWLFTEFSMTQRTAQKYMQSAEWAEGKSELISLLEPGGLYLLSAPSTPDGVWENTLDDLRIRQTDYDEPYRKPDLGSQGQEERRQSPHRRAQDQRRQAGNGC